MKIRRLTKKDSGALEQLRQLYSEVFELEDSAQQEAGYYLELLSNDLHLYFVAEQDQTIIGGLTAYLLRSPHGYSMVYVYDLAVAEEFQRRGIGTALMNALFAECRRLKVREMYVQADNEDVHAVRFYESLKGIRTGVTDFTYKIPLSLQ